MKTLLVVFGIAAGAAAAIVLRRQASESDPIATSPQSAPEQPLRPSAQTERIADAEGAVTHPGVREEESAQTDETKYERLIEREGEERHAAAERLLSDPLTERLATAE